jgi:tetratricopeptide (TPR) repeat protein
MEILMSNMHRLIIAGAVLALAGCSAVPPHEETPEQLPAAAETAEPLEGPLPEVELTPELLYQLLLAEFSGQAGALNLSASLYLKMAQETADPRLAQRATRIAIYARDLEVALPASRLWVELSPQNVEARQTAAALLISSGRSDEALPHLENLLHAAPGGESQGYMLIANLLSRAQDKEQAIALMEQLAAGQSDNPDALYATAHLAYQLDMHEKAGQLLETLLARHPDHTQALLLQARVLHGMGKGEAALQSLQRALQQNPDNDQLRMTYARMLVEASRLAEARQEFRLLNRHLPDDRDVLYALGLLALEADDTTEAKGYFSKLINDGEHEAEARFALGQIAESRKQSGEAIKWYQSVPHGERYMEAQLQAARLIAQIQGLEEARRYLQELPLDSAEDQIQRYLAEAELLSTHERYEEAMAIYDEALVLFIDNRRLLYARALTAEKVDRLDILEQDLRRILSMDPDNAQSLNALGYTLTDRTNRHQEALGYIERAYQLSPDDPAILDSMGWVHYRLGRLEEAIKFLQQAAEAANDGEIAAHLGEVLWVSGRKEEAMKVWNEALKSAPDHKVLQQTIERFNP